MAAVAVQPDDGDALTHIRTLETRRAGLEPIDHGDRRIGDEEQISLHMPRLEPRDRTAIRCTYGHPGLLHAARRGTTTA